MACSSRRKVYALNFALARLLADLFCLIATDVEGIFRLAGAERRIKELQSLFNSPEKYGKNLDWSGYTVHDAANILRRYLNQLPEPIIPLDFYERFRAPLRHHQAQAVGEMDHQGTEVGEFDPDEAIKTYQKSITELPPLNRQLLLYILDLLAVFASKSDINRMTAPNLSAIFQPGLLSHPAHDMAPAEYRLSQDVLIFLIENQDHFLVGMQGTAADEKTIQDVQSGMRSPSPEKLSSLLVTSGVRSHQSLDRSASNASAGADSVRRFGGVRRNLSVTSRHSINSVNSSLPGTPTPASSPFTPGGKSNGVHRSNTLPSRKSPSPALAAGRFQREKSPDTPTPHVVGLITTARSSPLSHSTSILPATPIATSKIHNGSAYESQTKSSTPQSGKSAYEISPHLRPVIPLASRRQAGRDGRGAESKNFHLEMPGSGSGPGARISPNPTPSKERSISNLFKPLPSAEPSPKDGRKHNKLQKKRAPELPAVSAHSSTHSLSASGTSLPSSPAFPPSARNSHSQPYGERTEMPFRPPFAPNDGAHEHAIDDSPYLTAVGSSQTFSSVGGRSPGRSPIRATVHGIKARDMAETTGPLKLNDLPQHDSEQTIRARRRQRSPAGSFSSAVDFYSLDNVNASEGSEVDKRAQGRRYSESSQKSFGHISNGEAVHSTTLPMEGSMSSAGSYQRSAGSKSDPDSTAGGNDAYESTRVGSVPAEKKSPFGWFKGKLQERKEREKSPPPMGDKAKGHTSKQSLNAVLGGNP